MSETATAHERRQQVSTITITVTNHACLVRECETRVSAEEDVTFRLGAHPSDLQHVQVILPGNVLCDANGSFTTFDLTPNDPSKTVKVCKRPTSGRHSLTITARRQGSPLTGVCDPAKQPDGREKDGRERQTDSDQDPPASSSPTMIIQ